MEKITINQIIDEVCQLYGLERHQIFERTRRYEISWPRQVAVALSYWYTDKSMLQVGKEFDRDHTTVLYAEGMVSKRVLEGDDAGLVELNAKLRKQYLQYGVLEREKYAAAINAKLPFDFHQDNLDLPAGR